MPGPQFCGCTRFSGRLEQVTTELRTWHLWGGDQSVSPFDPQDDTVNTMLAGLTVGYQVDLWEKISNSRKAFLLDQQSSRQDVESTALALTASASELWYGIAAEQATGFGAACRQLPGRNALSGGARS